MKRAIFVRSKMTIMAELEKRAREKGIYKVTLWGSFANYGAALLISCWLFLNFWPG